MGAVVVSGAKLMCPFGTAPGTLNATSQVTVLGCSKPVATITDIALGSNITPFGMCCSLASHCLAQT